MKTDEFLQSLRANNYSEHTIRAYKGDLADLEAYLDGLELTEDLAAAWLTAGRKTWSPNTTMRRMFTVRRYVGFTTGEKEFLANYQPPTPERARAHPLESGFEGVAQMIAFAGTDRRKALIALCGFCGLRVSEAVAIKPEHIDTETMILTVRGKGDKTRPVPISAKAWEAIEWAYNDALGQPGATLVRFGERQARNVVTHAARRAGLGHAASHDLRHTFITAVVDRTGNLRVAQELAGHGSSSTTEGYSQVTIARMREAVEALS